MELKENKELMYFTRYSSAKRKFLSDKKICKENINLYKKTLEYEEKKLKRKNNLPALDDGCYKTLYGYIIKFKNVNRWFKNKPLINLTKKEIQKFLEDFQDDKILNRQGGPYEDKESYYFKIFKSKLFEFIKKKDIVTEIMDEQFFCCKKRKEVRFIEEESFRKIIDVTIKPEHKLYLWLSWDIGENSFSWFQIEKRDFRRVINPDTKESEYHINLRKEILKRSRTSRTEITNFKETVHFLDLILSDLKDNDKLFNFGQRQAEKFFKRAVQIAKIKTIPSGDIPKLKDLRSSMACDLLRKGWSTDEVNSRLGHKPSSPEIDKYVNFLAIDRNKPKKKIYDNNLQKMQDEINTLKEERKILKMEFEKIKSFMNDFHIQIENLREQGNQAQKLVEDQIIKDYVTKNLSYEEVTNLINLVKSGNKNKAIEKINNKINKFSIKERKIIINDFIEKYSIKN